MLVGGTQTAGNKTIQCSATNYIVQSHPSGVYNYQVRAGEFGQTKKI